MAGLNSKLSVETGSGSRRIKSSGYSDSLNLGSTAKYSRESWTLFTYGTAATYPKLQSKVSVPTLVYDSGASPSTGKRSSSALSYLDSMEDPVVMYEDLKDRKNNQPTPEQKLQYSVLMSAITDLKSRIPELQIDARRWLRSNNCDYPFSFLICCESFGLNGVSVRQALEPYTKTWSEFEVDF